MVLAQGKSRRLKVGLGGPNQKDEEGCLVWPVCVAVAHPLGDSVVKSLTPALIAGGLLLAGHR
jgi:hypothetical protein